MLRVFLLLMIVLTLAACTSTPTRRESGASVPTTGAAPRAWKPPAELPPFIDHSVGEEEVSIQAMSLVGVPYRWGGNTPDSGFDCSGLVRYVVARAARVDLPRTTAEMSLVGNSIEPGEVAPGDLIFFNTTGRPHSHVGIYVGGYRFVNAPSTGGTVRIDYISNPYWAKRFDGIRRVASTSKPAAPFDAPRLMTSAPEPAPPRQSPPQTVVGAPMNDDAHTAADADAFEPPPASRAAAESQAAAEHAAPVDPIAAFAGPHGDPPDRDATTRDTPAEHSAQDPSANHEMSHDAGPAGNTARVSGSPAPSDDPIARFANGG
ncbi:MAG: NlpC/P60 family protein [Pararobbsia sp.]